MAITDRVKPFFGVLLPFEDGNAYFYLGEQYGEYWLEQQADAWGGMVIKTRIADCHTKHKATAYLRGLLESQYNINWDTVHKGWN